MSPHEFGGDWTEQKLAVLDDYLAAYCSIFSKNERARYFQTTYVDAFAGSGLIRPAGPSSESEGLFAELSERDAVTLLHGSARRAIEHSFNRYLFIEKSATRIADLEALKANSKNKERIIIRQGDANARLLKFVEETDWKKNRAVVFLDPYGMQVEWKTISALGQTKAVDLWLLFPLGQAVMRLLQRTKEPPREWQTALDRIFGTHEWIERFYVTKAEPDFFDADRVTSVRTADWSQVAAFMLERLVSVFEAVSPNPGVLWNSQNSPLYLFCFAAANKAGAPTALKIAGNLLKKINS
jgi:three-Cys-motif partner protein